MLGWNVYRAKTWLRTLFSLRGLEAWLIAVGAMWLLVEVAAFFFADVTVPHTTTKVPNYIRSLWPWFFGAGVVLAAIASKPRLSFSRKLNGRDIAIRIIVGDLFKQPGAIVVGSNTTFDTQISQSLISENSVQGVFTKKYYSDGRQLETELGAALKNIPSERLTGNRVGNSVRYGMGTCAVVHPKERTAYFVAIADVNEHGVCSASFEDLKECLAKLWVFIGSRGAKGPIVMPIIGTGFGRIPQTRTEVIHEVVKSFVAACSEKTFCEDLTIAIHPADAVKYSISLKELEAFVHHECTYTGFASGNRPPLGNLA